MTDRMAPEREREIRDRDLGVGALYPGDEPGDFDRRDLLAELDAVRTERDRLREAASTVRAGCIDHAVVDGSWLRCRLCQRSWLRDKAETHNADCPLYADALRTLLA